MARHAYWVILVGATPTAFRSSTRDVLVPTLRQLQRTQSDVTLRWFERGRLWESPEAARFGLRAKPPDAEKRRPEWRPGGDHRDPRARFELTRDQKRARFKDRERRPREPPAAKSGSGAAARLAAAARSVKETVVETLVFRPAAASTLAAPDERPAKGRERPRRPIPRAARQSATGSSGPAPGASRAIHAAGAQTAVRSPKARRRSLNNGPRRPRSQAESHTGPSRPTAIVPRAPDRTNDPASDPASRTAVDKRPWSKDARPPGGPGRPPWNSGRGGPLAAEAGTAIDDRPHRAVSPSGRRHARRSACVRRRP